MKKKLLVLLFTLLAILANPLNAYGTVIFTVGSTSYQYDQQIRTMDMAPFIDQGRTFLPVRYIANSIGIADDNIKWNPDTRVVTILKDNQTIEMAIGSKAMLVNSTEIDMDVAPGIKYGRTVLPVRFVAQALGIDITWNPANNSVTIGEKTQPTNNSAANQVIIPGITYDSSVNKESRDFTWQYNGISYSWHVDVPGNLLAMDREIKKLTEDFYDGKYPQSSLLKTMSGEVRALVLANSDTQNGNFVPWVKETNNSEWAENLSAKLADQSKHDGYDYFHQAEFMQSFVGGAMDYIYTDVSQLPAQTLIDNGDCKDKSILLAAILNNLGYKTALLMFPPDSQQQAGHMALGIVFNDQQIPKNKSLSFYKYNGLKYYFAETTTAGWHIGDASMTEPANIYVIN